MRDSPDPDRGLGRQYCIPLFSGTDNTLHDPDADCPHPPRNARPATLRNYSSAPGGHLVYPGETGPALPATCPPIGLPAIVWVFYVGRLKIAGNGSADMDGARVRGKRG